MEPDCFYHCVYLTSSLYNMIFTADSKAKLESNLNKTFRGNIPDIRGVFSDHHTKNPLEHRTLGIEGPGNVENIDFCSTLKKETVRRKPCVTVALSLVMHD